MYNYNLNLHILKKFRFWVIRHSIQVSERVIYSGNSLFDAGLNNGKETAIIFELKDIGPKC